MKMMVEVEINDEDLVCPSCIALEEKALQEKVSKPCFNCGKPSECNHHVVPKSLGGIATVPLCLVCHGKVHGKDLLKMRELFNKAIKVAKENGQFTGGTPKFWEKVENKRIVDDPEGLEKLKKFNSMYQSGMKQVEMLKHIDVSKGTMSRWCKDMRDEQSRIFLRTKELRDDNPNSPRGRNLEIITQREL